MNLRKRDWGVIAGEAGLFFIVLIVLYLDEYVDLPYHMLGAAQTPYRPQEYVLESLSVLVVAIIVIMVTYIILRRTARLERFLRVCAWCRKVWVNEKWVSFEEYALKRHSLKSSHGICDECVDRLEKKAEQKKADKQEGS
ncbi:MAG: hypothetical protein ABSC14_10885 [Desulfomonilia bacterium]|jgi:hypothetical protein